ncbi:MAG: thiamine-phosphate kinase [Vicinamibacterales bacterium]
MTSNLSPDNPGMSGERDVIARIRARVPAAPPWLLVGIGDDAAVVKPERGALEILTTDGLVEGVHFDRRFSGPREIGWKALAVNLSDIAAMGGTPRLALLSLALPASASDADVDAILDGFLALAAESRVTLAGGNITRSPGPLMIDVTVVGFARARHILTRSGGRAGDDLYVTGEIGAAAAGLSFLQRQETGDAKDPNNLKPRDARGAQEALNNEGMAACVRRHCAPEPRLRIGALLGRNRAATACMDLSDGLADAVRQIAEASGTGAAIDAAGLPIPSAARQWYGLAGIDPILAATAGGDDYELLFSAPRRARGRLATVTRQARGVPIARIGQLTKEPQIVLVRDGVPEPLPRGFVHF